MGHVLEDRFRAARKSLNAGDKGPFLALMDNDVMWWDTGIDEPLIGLDAVAKRLDELADYRICDDVHDVFACSEHLVALIHAEAQDNDDRFKYSTAEIYHFNKDGLISKRQAFAHDPSTIAQFLRRRS